jgi:hypothetical protein
VGWAGLPYGNKILLLYCSVRAKNARINNKGDSQTKCFRPETYLWQESTMVMRSFFDIPQRYLVRGGGGAEGSISAFNQGDKSGPGRG